MKLAMLQMKAEETLEANLEKALCLTAQAADAGADLVVLPEIHLTKFFPQHKNATPSSITIDDPIVKKFQDLCKEKGIYALPNFYLKEEGGIFDASVLIDREGNVAGIQKMVHIAEAEQFYEQSYYTPSDDGFHVYDTDLGRIGVVVCFDRHYPESIRTEALKGAELILVPTANTKAEPSEMFQWEILVQAFQNSVAIAMCNRVGLEDEMDFSGESLVCDALGNLLCKGSDEEEILYAELDLSESTKIREGKPYTNLRRIEWYQ